MGIKKIKVLVVDDSMLMRELISSNIGKDVSIEVIGTATDPFDAMEKIEKLQPDVMTLDVEMPKMNGIDFLKKLMPTHPLPVVVVSSLNSSVFDALSAGAVDFVHKATTNSEVGRGAFITELLLKIKIASIAKVGQYKNTIPAARPMRTGEKDRIIAIGASTGGTEALQNILCKLGRDLPGIVIVQHMPPVFTRLYAERLNNACNMEIQEAKDGDMVLPGKALIAPGNFQMTVQAQGNGYRVACKEGEKVSGHCPSVDVLFESVTKAAGGRALGVILTGMGRDGAKGLLKMKTAGASTIGQDEASCIVYGMPAVAKEIGAVGKQVPLDDIANEIARWCNTKKENSNG